MLNFLDNCKYTLLLGRVALALVYFLGGLGWLIHLSPPIAYIAARGLPIPAVLGWVALIFKLGGSTLVILGLWTRLGALMLVAFTLVTSWVFHPFWVDGQSITFLKETAMIGGLLVLASTGPGGISFDAMQKTRPEAPPA